MQDRTDVIITD